MYGTDLEIPKATFNYGELHNKTSDINELLAHDLNMLSLSHLPACIIDLKGQILTCNLEFEGLRNTTNYLLSGPNFLISAREGQIQLSEFLNVIRSEKPDQLNRNQRSNIYVRSTVEQAAFWISGAKISGRPHIVITVYAPNLSTIDAKRLTQRLEALFGLSPAEAQTALYLGRGLKAKDIAHARIVSLPTVRSQISAIRDKIGAATSLQAVAIITRLSLPL